MAKAKYQTRREPPNPNHRRQPDAKASAHEMLERRLFLLQLLESGATKSLARQACMAPVATREMVQKGKRGGLALTEAQFEHLYREIVRHRQTDFEQERAYFKSEQATRLRTWIVKAANGGKWNAVASLEEKLAKVLGTYEPVKVRIDEVTTVTQNLVAYIARMNEHDIDELLQEQADLDALASEARARGILPPARVVAEHLNGNGLNGTKPS